MEDLPRARKNKAKMKIEGNAKGLFIVTSGSRYLMD